MAWTTAPTPARSAPWLRPSIAFDPTQQVFNARLYVLGPARRQ
ncbi:MAG: hypothetical protein WKG07_11820 [Hymenobacter sp.]